MLNSFAQRERIQKRKAMRKNIKEKKQIMDDIITLFEQFQSESTDPSGENVRQEIRVRLLQELEPAYTKFMENKNKNEAIQTSLIRANIDLCSDKTDFLLKQIDSVKTFFIFKEFGDGNKLLTSIIKSLDNKVGKTVLDKIDEVMKLKS